MDNPAFCKCFESTTMDKNLARRPLWDVVKLYRKLRHANALFSESFPPLSLDSTLIRRYQTEGLRYRRLCMCRCAYLAEARTRVRQPARSASVSSVVRIAANAAMRIKIST
jgi:hypothetical protein